MPHEPNLATLLPTLTFRDTPVLNRENSRVPVAWQAGLPVPDFCPQDRPRLDLGGLWRKRRFQADHTLSLSRRDGATLAALEADRYHTADFDELTATGDGAWQDKMLPGVENAMPATPGDRNGPERYEDGVWYRRRVAIAAGWAGHQVTLKCLAINYVADVWVNGAWAGYHEGGYTPFALDVTRWIRPGAENVIALRVDNPPWDSRPDIVPAITPDWWNHSGVIHDLWLEATPSWYIVRADVLTPDLSGEVQVRVVLHRAEGAGRAEAAPEAGQLILTIRETDPHVPAWLGEPFIGACAAAPVAPATQIAVAATENLAGEALVVQATLHIPHVRHWAPGAPALYALDVQFAALDQSGARTGTEDRLMVPFGVRTVRAEGCQLLLNEQPCFLAGVARHEEWPDTGRTATWSRILQDLTLIRGLGASFVRTAHYPNHVQTYLALDRLGLAAAVEIPLWQYTEREYAAQESRQLADQMWREMILSNRNRPCILFWSSNNESREVNYRRRYMERLLVDYRARYPDGRLVIQSAAADAPGPHDASQALTDVAGWTMYFGIFHGSTYRQGTADFLQAAHAHFPDKPILNTEYGIWSYGGESDEKRQQEVFLETFRALSAFSTRDASGAFHAAGYVCGIVWWTAFDWYTAHTRLQTMGLLTMDRQHEKPVAALLRAAYRVWAP